MRVRRSGSEGTSRPSLSSRPARQTIGAEKKKLPKKMKESASPIPTRKVTRRRDKRPLVLLGSRDHLRRVIRRLDVDTPGEMNELQVRSERGGELRRRSCGHGESPPADRLFFALFLPASAVHGTDFLVWLTGSCSLEISRQGVDI